MLVGPVGYSLGAIGSLMPELPTAGEPFVSARIAQSSSMLGPSKPSMFAEGGASCRCVRGPVVVQGACRALCAVRCSCRFGRMDVCEGCERARSNSRTTRIDSHASATRTGGESRTGANALRLQLSQRAELTQLAHLAQLAQLSELAQLAQPSAVHFGVLLAHVALLLVPSGAVPALVDTSSLSARVGVAVGMSVAAAVAPVVGVARVGAVQRCAPQKSTTRRSK